MKRKTRMLVDKSGVVPDPIRAPRACASAFSVKRGAIVNRDRMIGQRSFAVGCPLDWMKPGDLAFHDTCLHAVSANVLSIKVGLVGHTGSSHRCYYV